METPFNFFSEKQLKLWLNYSWHIKRITNIVWMTFFPTCYFMRHVLHDSISWSIIATFTQGEFPWILHGFSKKILRSGMQVYSQLFLPTSVKIFPAPVKMTRCEMTVRYNKELTNNAHNWVRPFCAASCSGVNIQRSVAFTSALYLIKSAAISTCWK